MIVAASPWGQDHEQPVLVILIHSLAHKYYHRGQLQAILYLLKAL
jgi:uncharacterized damage-inducible protein DinB